MARPRIIPLRDQAGYSVDDLAPFTLLAYMCWPAREDGYKRSRAIQYLRSEFATGRATRGDGRWRLLGKDGCRVRRGAHAGQFVLSACQLFENQRKPTVENVARLIALHRKETGDNAKAIGAAGQSDRLVLNNRGELVANFRAFRAVAHIWAAYVWLADTLDDDLKLLPWAVGTKQAVPRIMGMATAMARFANHVPRGGQDPGRLLDPAQLWWSDLGALCVPATYRPPAMPESLVGQLE